MGFGQAIASGFANYVNFSGRATRPAYWYFVLFLVIVGIVTALIDVLVLGATEIGLTNAIFSLATLLPSLAVTIRRLHDTGRTGWWIFLAFVPLIGIILLIVWWCQRGEPGPNAYGPAPAA
jgi:uncharacterized membrane protein YhaH (DUF805 family)